MNDEDSVDCWNGNGRAKLSSRSSTKDSALRIFSRANTFIILVRDSVVKLLSKGFLRSVLFRYGSSRWTARGGSREREQTSNLSGIRRRWVLLLREEAARLATAQHLAHYCQLFVPQREIAPWPKANDSQHTLAFLSPSPDALEKERARATKLRTHSFSPRLSFVQPCVVSFRPDAAGSLIAFPHQASAGQ